MSEEHQKSIRIRRRASGLLLSKHLPDDLLNSGGPPRILHNPAGGAHVVCHIEPALSSDQVTIPAVEYLGGWIHFFKAYRALRDIWGSSGRGTHACLHPYIYFYIHSISILTLLPTLKLKSILFLIHNLLSSVKVMPAKELCILELGLCKLSRRNKTKHYNYMYISMTSPIP